MTLESFVDGTLIDRIQAAAIAGISPLTFKNFVTLGRMPRPVCQRGRTRFWLASEVREAAENRVRPLGENRVSNPAFLAEAR